MQKSGAGETIVINCGGKKTEREKESGEYRNVLPALCQHHQVVGHRKANGKTSETESVFTFQALGFAH